MHYYSIQLYNKLEEETGQVCLYILKGMLEHYLEHLFNAVQCKVTLTVISVMSCEINTVINTN